MTGNGETAQLEPRENDHSVELESILKLASRREPAVAQVVTWVGLGIIEGRLKPGEDLNSVELSHRFNSSRTPVREALMLLEQEGLVEMRARRRPRVASFTPKKVREIYFVRQHLLELVGQLVVKNITDDDLVELREHLNKMLQFAENGDVDNYFWLHVTLQERMTDICGNETLKGILDSLALRTLVLRHASLAQPDRLLRSAKDQVRILDAIESRDGELASMLFARATVSALGAIEQAEFAGLAGQVTDDDEFDEED